jgi:deoxyribonuclease IV
MVHYFGADIGCYDDLELAEENITKLGGNLLQIFIIPGKKYKTMYATFKSNKIKIFVHASYLNNLCRPWDKYSWWISNLINEIDKATQVNAEGVVLHFGKTVGQSIEESYNNMFTSLLYVHTQTLGKCKILLETPAGQGTEICSDLDSMSYFYNKIQNCNLDSFKKRIKICVDTCHIFSAGYNISNRKGIEKYFKAFDLKIGIKNINLIHLNDSKTKFKSHVDRHESLGDGFIGYNSIEFIYNFFKKQNIPIILETPEVNHKIEINKLLFSTQ